MTLSSRLPRIIVGLALLAGLPMYLGQGCPSPASSSDGSSSGNHSDGSTSDNTTGGDTNSPPVGVDITIAAEGDHTHDHQHVPAGQQVTYQNNPPASGPHWSSSNPAAPAAHGFYTTTLNEEQWVHNLEHAYVVILYDCKGVCEPTLLSNLQSFANSVPNSVVGYPKIVITPYSGLPYQLMAVAWHVQMNLQSFDHDKLLAFYNAHMGICDDCELTAP